MACCYQQSHLFSQENNHSQRAQRFVPNIGNIEKKCEFSTGWEDRTISASNCNFAKLEFSIHTRKLSIVKF